MVVKCAHCGNEVDLPTGHVNRARSRGLNVYCGRVCSGLGRRVDRDPEEKRLAKVVYDKVRRAALGDKIKHQKAEYYQRNREEILAKQKAQSATNPELKRKRRECQDRCQSRPEWKAHKREYDRKYRAVKEYGEYADAFLLILSIDEEIADRVDWVDLQRDKGTLNKSQRRKRDGKKEHVER